MQADFTFQASLSCSICFVAGHSRWRTTASCPGASHLPQPKLV